MTESEFQEFIITLGYRYNEKSKTAFNSFEKFHTEIKFNPDKNRYIFSLCAETKSNNITQIQKILKSFLAEHKNNIIKAKYFDKTITVSLKMTVDSDIDKEKLKQTSKFIMDMCKSDKIAPVCKVCGNIHETGLYIVGRELMPICDDCVIKKRKLYEHRKNVFELKHQNMFGGILGAIFGALFGASVYVLLYQIFAAFGISTVFIVLFSFMGFVLAGQRATKKSGIICSVIAFIVMIAAEYIAIVTNMAILIEHQGGGIAITEAISATNMSLTDSDFLFSVIIDLIIGTAVIIIIGIGYFLKRKFTRPLKISKNIL